MPYRFKHRHVLGIEQLSAKDIELILDTAEKFKHLFGPPPIRKVPALRHMLVVMAFFEPSTRTRMSFEAAAKRLNADTMNFSASSSSLVKGETLIDTIKNIEAMHPSIIVIRHKSSGAPQLVAQHTNASVLNAGDGWHEHPSQALLDMFTIRQKKGTLSGLKVAIVGDITHSRVAHSNMYGLVKMGADVHIAGPATMLPRDAERLGVHVHNRVHEAVEGADVVMALRIQLERMEKTLFPSNREYHRFFGLDSSVLKLAKKDHIFMHPGPINRGVEVEYELADSERSVVLEQVTNGIAVRMALLYLVSGRSVDQEALK